MNRYFFFATALYLLFVIYGSLVPLEFRDLPMETALNHFKNIRYLKLGANSRADWIANILLYIPLSASAAALFGGARHPLTRALLSVGVLVFCLALAITLEFTQLFFPPRTVSLNDLIAESLGTVIGILGWQFWGGYFSRLYHHMRRGNLLSARAAIIFYILIYTALSLFPFDFVTSFAELDTKLAHGHDAVILPLEECGAKPLRCGVKLLVEMLVMLPLGLLFCYLPYLQHRRTVAVLAGFLLGAVIEIMQIFLLSGSGQGLSVVTRMIGMGAGAALFIWARQRDFTGLIGLARRVSWFIVPPYLFLVLSINDWFTADWLTTGQALEKLTETHFLPLYYYYYTSEAVALVSLLGNMGAYLPIGLWCWVHFSNRDDRQHPAPSWLYAGLFAALFALVVETGKLFLAEKHADPSNVSIAFFAAVGSCLFMNRLLQWINPDKTSDRRPIIKHIAQPPPAFATEKPVKQARTAFDVNKNWRGVSLLLWSVTAAAVFDYPVAAVGLGLFLIGYTALLMRYPQAWLIVIPGLLPVMDFAPWTGRFFLDEFDLLILSTLAFYYWRKPRQEHPLAPLFSTPTILLLALFMVLYGVSLFRGLLPLQVINANAFASYYSNYNSLRVGKGVLWALLLLPLLQHSIRHYRHATLYLGYGVLMGLAGVIAASCWERFLFPGLFNFSSNYRIIALFSTMHTGGGHIDAYLALTLPFIALLFLQSSRPWLTGLAGIGLFVTGLYVLLVTFSRGPYLAVAAGFVVLAVGLLWCFKSDFVNNGYKFLLLPLLLLAIVPWIAMPVFEGTFIQARFHDVNRDIGIRKAHWRDAVAMMEDDVPTHLFGMGIGSYPRIYLWRNTENVIPAMYRIDSEKGNQFLKLSSGDSLYMGQFINTAPHATYLLRLDLRSKKDTATLTIPICEKSLLYSFRCSWNTISEKSPAGQWRHIERLIDSKDVGEPLGKTVGDLSKRPVQLSLYNGASNTIVDVDNVSLTDAMGKNLIANGDFTHGTDSWFFSTDNHLPWHIKNLSVHVLFDQGWLGLGVFFLLFAKAIYTLCRQLPRQNTFAAILLASFSGFMVVGFVDSPFDAPRLSLLFFLLLFLALMQMPYVRGGKRQDHKPAAML